MFDNEMFETILSEISINLEKIDEFIVGPRDETVAYAGIADALYEALDEEINARNYSKMYGELVHLAAFCIDWLMWLRENHWDEMRE